MLAASSASGVSTPRVSHYQAGVCFLYLKGCKQPSINKGSSVCILFAAFSPVHNIDCSVLSSMDYTTFHHREAICLQTLGIQTFHFNSHVAIQTFSTFSLRKKV